MERMSDAPSIVDSKAACRYLAPLQLLVGNFALIAAAYLMLLLLLGSHTPGLLIAAVALAGSGFGSSLPSLISWLGGRVSDSQRFTGCLLFASRVICVATVLLLGSLIEATPQAFVFIVSGFFAVTCILLVVVSCLIR